MNTILIEKERYFYYHVCFDSESDQNKQYYFKYIFNQLMLTNFIRRFASNTKVYGNLKDSDRIFTNVYKDSDPYIAGALRRVKLVYKLGRLA